MFCTSYQCLMTKSSTDNLQDKISINIVNENNNTQSVGGYVQQGRVVNKWIYFILAFFLGWIGAHKFYSGFSGKGIMYLVFSWTGIPALIAFFTAIMTLLKPADQNGNIIVSS
ncbi:TM2 domain-containing protein [Enterococcus sp. DIV0242_7C1]|nr:TM2 domain-containing protein [Enterococcus sp. DIV0242_7C1]